MTHNADYGREWSRHPAFAIIEKTLWDYHEGRLSVGPSDGVFGLTDAILHNLGAGGFDIVRLANWVKRNAIDGSGAGA